MSDALTYNVNNKIYKLLKGKFDRADEIYVESIKLNVDYSDLGDSNIKEIEIKDIPEQSILIDGVTFVSEAFGSTSGDLEVILDIGLKNTESSDASNNFNRINRIYTGGDERIFSSQMVLGINLSDTGVFVPNGTCLDFGRIINQNGNTLIAKYRLGGVWSVVESGGNTVYYGADANTDVFSGTAGTGASVGKMLGIGGRIWDISNPSTHTTSTTTTKEWDSTTPVWVSGGNLNTARQYLGAAGDQDKALAIAGVGAIGSSLDTTELYNGSTWTADATLNTERCYLASSGADDDGTMRAMVVGGTNRSISDFDDLYSSEVFDGTSWAIGGNMSVKRTSACGVSSLSSLFTRFIVIGGENYWNEGTSADVNSYHSCEEYDGWTWNLIPSLNLPRKNAAACGTISSILVSGGVSTKVSGDDVMTYVRTSTEEYDGVAWSVVSTHMSGTDSMAGYSEQALAGTTSSALQCSGWSYFKTVPWGDSTNITEEYTGPSGLSVDFADLDSGEMDIYLTLSYRK